MAVQTTYPQQVKEVMTRDIVALRPQQPFAQALALLAQHRFRHLLVIDADARLAGVISDRDLLRCMSRETDLERVTVANIMWVCRGDRATGHLTVRSRCPDAEPSHQLSAGGRERPGLRDSDFDRPASGFPDHPNPY